MGVSRCHNAHDKTKRNLAASYRILGLFDVCVELITYWTSADSDSSTFIRLLYFVLRGLVLNLNRQQGHHNPSHV